MKKISNATGREYEKTKSGGLSNLRIGKRIAILVILGLVGLAALSMIYVAGDSKIERETALADEYPAPSAARSVSLLGPSTRWRRIRSAPVSIWRSWSKSGPPAYGAP